MTSSEPKDTYVILHDERHGCWAAFRLNTRQLGMGANPKEAIANSTEALATHSNTHGSDVSYKIMLTLSRTAQPLPDGGDYTPGTVYKY